MDFTVKDSSGASHRYDLTRHPGSEGMCLALFLSGLVIEPLTAAAGPILVSTLVAAMGGAKISVGGILSSLRHDPTILEGLDSAGIGRAARGVLASLDDATIYALLRYVNRDGTPLVHNGRPTGAFDEAYSGNYTELGLALWQVASINGFFPVVGTSAPAKPAAS